MCEGIDPSLLCLISLNHANLQVSRIGASTGNPESVRQFAAPTRP
jgi:hypothetical protein